MKIKERLGDMAYLEYGGSRAVGGRIACRLAGLGLLELV